MAQKKSAQQENTESRQLVEAAFELARSLQIEKLLVQADEVRDIRRVEKLRDSEQLVWLTRKSDELPVADTSDDIVIQIPDVTLTRMSQIKVGLLLASLNGSIELDESILCLSGVAGSERLDTLLIANPQRDFPWFRKRDVEQTRELIATSELATIIDIALRLAVEGREGKTVGTTFVLGDPEELAPYRLQLVLNPLEGHPKKNRNIHDLTFAETIREFAALDGAFIVSNRGIVESAGTYLDATGKSAKTTSGLGARHKAAAAITAETKAIAVVLSSSSHTVTVFHGGESILELERPMIR